MRRKSLIFTIMKMNFDVDRRTVCSRSVTISSVGKEDVDGKNFFSFFLFFQLFVRTFRLEWPFKGYVWFARKGKSLGMGRSEETRRKWKRLLAPVEAMMKALRNLALNQLIGKSRRWGLNLICFECMVVLLLHFLCVWYKFI